MPKLSGKSIANNQKKKKIIGEREFHGKGAITLPKWIPIQELKYFTELKEKKP